MQSISRSEAINRLLSLSIAPRTYLEIGVRRGETFHAVCSERKIAVDPKFIIKAREPESSYHEITSDDFFSDNTEQFDLIFLDGMHTFEQTLRDLLNAIVYLKPRGVVVIDDVRPSSYAAALHSEARAQELKKALGIDDGGAWMGDVFRLVFFIETFLQAFSYATIRETHGVLVLWKKPRGSIPYRRVADVAAMDYVDAVLTANYRELSITNIIEDILRQ